MLINLKRLFSSRPSKVAREIAYKREGDKHLHLNGLEQAAACYRQAVSINPEYAQAYVGLGFVLAEQNQCEEAERVLSRALSIDPDIADTHYILGRLAKAAKDQKRAASCFSRALELKPDLEFAYRELFDLLIQSSRLEDAKALITKAIAAFPGSAEFHFSLGSLLFSQQDFDGAVSCLNHAVSLQPDAAVAHKVLGDVYRALGEHETAVGCYEDAILIDADYADAHVGLGDAMASLGEDERSIACFEQALALKPDHVAAHQSLGNAFVTKGDRKSAVARYREVLKLQPQNPVRHLVAALSGENSDRAPSAYVEQLFDDYAQHFDSHLVQTLQYKVPESLVDLVRNSSHPSSGQWAVLDLGCGTGLVGLAIAPHAKNLVGVDLSSKMLSKARARNVYSRLEQQDLLSMMQGEASSWYDVILSADVFIYIGRLDELVSEARRLLRPKGLFAFSVESLDVLTDGRSTSEGERDDYLLNPTGRYAHSSSYLIRMAQQNGFEVLNSVQIQIRLDQGSPIQGCLMLWRRLSDTAPATR